MIETNKNKKLQLQKGMIVDMMNHLVLTVLRVNTDPDPAFLLNPDPVPS
jgi:hypothetical protein